MSGKKLKLLDQINTQIESIRQAIGSNQLEGANHRISELEDQLKEYYRSRLLTGAELRALMDRLRTLREKIYLKKDFSVD
ncbi:MAG: hypothetical protein Kow0037_20380 [Calditrichia bacterium]